MRCLSPLLVKAPAWYHFATGWQSKYMPVPCGKCEACLESMQKSWFVRLYMQYKYSNNASMVTLTYDDDHLHTLCSVDMMHSNGVLFLHACPSKTDFQKFFNMMRQYLRRPTFLRKYGFDENYDVTKLKYYCVSEYGTKRLRPHFHVIFFNLPELKVQYCNKSNKYRWIAKLYDMFHFLWKHGNVHVSDGVSDSSLLYCSYYVNKKSDVPEFFEPCFRLMSKNLGIDFVSSDLANSLKLKKSKILYINGYHYKLPRYYESKIFDESEIISMRNSYYQEEFEKVNQLAKDVKAGLVDLQEELNKMNALKRDYIEKRKKKNNNRKDI